MRISCVDDRTFAGDNGNDEMDEETSHAKSVPRDATAMPHFP